LLFAYFEAQNIGQKTLVVVLSVAKLRNKSRNTKP